MNIARIVSLGLLLAWPGLVTAAYPGADWKHSGSIFLLTTPEGANLPATVTVQNFPLLVRLHRDFFDFRQTRPQGDDIRFSSSSGEALAFQIEEWNAAQGHATIWVKVPQIVGNARQEIKLHWGNPQAKSESNGKAVFDPENGYLSVWHMGDSGIDEVGTLLSKDTGTAATAGVIGSARRFPGGKGIFGGDKITDYPAGSNPHTTEVWFRAEKPNANVIAWGNEQAQGKVVMQYRSPPHIRMDCYFSDGNVESKSSLPKAEWVHVAHTYEKGNSRMYINGVLDGATKSNASPLNIRNPARLWIGGWYNNYDFVGDIDEVRVSKVARSADWLRLQYENQKPLQTLVGPVVQAGEAFDVAQSQIIIAEGQQVTLKAQAGGAQKVYWTETRNGQETVVATDRLNYTFNAGRTVGEAFPTIRFKAVYPKEVKVRQVPIQITEAIPEPMFTLNAPSKWNGRDTIEVVPQISNLEAMKAKGAAKLNVIWTVAEIATIRELKADRLVLTRAQNSGSMTVTASIDNGGTPTTQSVKIDVTEPKRDSWVYSFPADPTVQERPVDNQFFARDTSNVGRVAYRGQLKDKVDAVFIKLYADGKLATTRREKPEAENTYLISAQLNPGLITYKVEFGTVTGEKETILHTAGNLVCGDAYIIQGQSNAVATDFGKDDPAYTSEWIRSFGTMSGDAKSFTGWGNAVHRSRDGGKLQIGYWGMELGRRIVEAHKIPVCFINGAVGGTRIDQHQRNAADPFDLTTIYGRLLWRVNQAQLTHGIRGVIWHQGENDQGADGPTGGYGYETYRQYFIDLAAAWKTDFPNIQHYYLFQIWPKSCAMGINGSDNRLREVQRTLPKAFSNLSIMSTLGIDPPGGCHFPAAGYAEFARLMFPLLERDHYGKKPQVSITPPNLIGVTQLETRRDELLLEFDQPVKWSDDLVGQFSLDGAKGGIATGEVAGRTLRLKLKVATQPKTITYLDSVAWSQKTLLTGENGLAALTFCEVPILRVRQNDGN